jgi:hypothetical protein
VLNVAPLLTELFEKVIEAVLFAVEFTEKPALAGL